MSTKGDSSGTLSTPADSPCPVTVLFVCLGNICRSPLAAAIFSAYAAKQHPELAFRVLSAGTGAHTVGEPADERGLLVAQNNEAAALAGVHARLKSHIARALSRDMLIDADVICVMDEQNHAAVTRQWKALSLAQLSAVAHKAPLESKLFYFGSFAHCKGETSPTSFKRSWIIKDPWYGSLDGFQAVYDQCLAATRGFFEHHYRAHCCGR